MSSLKRAARVATWTAVCVMVLLVGVVPQRYIPQQVAPFVAAKGTFAGEVVRLVTQEGWRREASARIEIEMEEGVCRVGLDHGEGLKTWFSAQKCRMSDRIPAGSTLILDPQGSPGSYDLFVGPQWHPLSPNARRFLLVPAAIVMFVSFIFAGRRKSLIEKLGTRRFAFLISILLVSGLVLYPAAHEGGHLMVGMLLGATPDWGGVVWTPLMGEQPHASFSYMPEGAGPFMSAGGTVVPTLVALVLLIVWRLVRTKASWYISATLVGIAVLFLFTTVGCLLELYSNGHMDALPVHFGLTGPFRVLLSLSPLLVAIGAYVWIGMTLRGSALGKVHMEETAAENPDSQPLAPGGGR